MEEKEKIEYTKLRERIVKAIEIVKDVAKKEGLPFNQELLLEACKLGETLFVRSEIAYSSNKG